MTILNATIPISAAPADDDLLQFDSASGLWVPSKVIENLTAISSGKLTITGPSSQNYEFGTSTLNAGQLGITGTTAGQPSRIALTSFAGDGTDTVRFDIFGVGSNDRGFADDERLTIGYVAAAPGFHAILAGGAVLRKLVLAADNTVTQLVLNINGTIDTGGNLTVGSNLGVNGTLGVSGHATFDTTIQVDGNTQLGNSTGDAVQINLEYILPQVVGTTDFLVKQTGAGTLWGYTTSTPTSGNWGFWNRTGTTITTKTANDDFTIGGAINVAGKSNLSNMTIKPWVAVATWASLGHKDGTGSGDYALIQSNAGRTIINSSSGQNLSFRIGNDDKMVITDGSAIFSRSASDSASAETQFIWTRERASGGGVLVDNDRVGSFLFRGETGTGLISGAALRVAVDGAVAADSVPMEFCFEVMKPTETSRTTAMDIRSNLLVEMFGGLDVLGGPSTFGDGTNEMQVSGTGDLSFAGTAGFIYGHMDVPAAAVITVDTSGSGNPIEIKDDGTGSANDGWESVYVNGTIFATSDLHYITVTVAGTYEVIWDMAIMTNAGPGTEIHGGITIDSTTFQRDNGENHAHVFNNNDDISLGAVGVVDCPNGNEEISLWVSNDAAQKTIVEHGNMRIKMIGGT